MSKSKDFQIRTTSDLLITMAVGETVSTAVDLLGVSLGGFLFPASFTATSLTFQGSVDGLNYFPLKDLKTGANLAATCAASSIALTSPQDFAFIRFIKIVGNTVQLTADKEVKLLTRSLA
jgi:hypothetical protein